MSHEAVVLLSGGLDSTTVLAIARERGFECYALSFHYGQRHFSELRAAANVAYALNTAEHRVVNIEMPWSKSALTKAAKVPKDRAPHEIARGIPITYVPARNMIFLAYALSWAESLGANDIFAGMNVLDYSGYPDCRPEFVSAFQVTARLGTQAGVEGAAIMIHTPLISMNKAEIIREGVRLGVDYSATLSCYDPESGQPCRACDSCQLRAKGFKEAGLADPAMVTT
jgi:7-cyano-7-deazaguanine synthase